MRTSANVAERSPLCKFHTVLIRHVYNSDMRSTTAIIPQYRMHIIIITQVINCYVIIHITTSYNSNTQHSNTQHTTDITILKTCLFKNSQMNCVCRAQAVYRIFAKGGQTWSMSKRGGARLFVAAGQPQGGGCRSGIILS